MDYTVAQFRRNIREALNYALKGERVTIKRYDEVYTIHAENTTTQFQKTTRETDGGESGDALLEQETTPPDKEVIEKGARLLEDMERL